MKNAYVVLYNTPRNKKWRLSTKKIFKNFSSAERFASGSGVNRATRVNNLTAKVKKIRIM